MRFRMQALDAGQQVVSLTLEAASEAAAREEAGRQGLQVFFVKARGLHRTARFSVGLFSAELMALLEAGLNLVEALQTLAEKGSNEVLAPVKLDLDFDKAFSTARVGAYERLLLDAVAGRLNLFVRSDEQEEAWRWVEPVLAAWRGDTTGPRPYAAGSWGPPAASALIARDGFAWDEEA